MKTPKILLFIFLFIIGTSINGQTKPTQTKKPVVTTKPTASTVSKPVTRVTTASQQEVGYLITPLNLSTNKLPVGFKGNNPVDVFSKILIGRMIKGEFETTSEYEKRILIADTKPIIGKLSIDSFFVFKIPTSYSMMTYDADVQKMTVSYETDIYADELPESSLSIKIFSKSKKYVGSNAFGRTVTITAYDETRYNLVMPNFDDLKPVSSKDKYLPALLEFSLDVNTAKQIKLNNSLGCLFIGKLVDPFYNIGFYSDEATIDSPLKYDFKYRYIYMKVYQVWFYNTMTGKVLFKNEITKSLNNNDYNSDSTFLKVIDELSKKVKDVHIIE